jgi:hypothetical protein
MNELDAKVAISQFDAMIADGRGQAWEFQH